MSMTVLLSVSVITFISRVVKTCMRRNRHGTNLNIEIETRTTGKAKKRKQEHE
jgi:hypothetical protein